MKEQTPPLENIDQEVGHTSQEISGSVRAVPEGVGLSQKEIDEIEKLEHQIKYEKNKISQGKKFNNAGVIYGVPPQKNSGFGLKRWAIGAFAGLLSLGASAKSTKGSEDSLKTKPLIEKVDPGKIEVKERLKIREVTAQERNDWNSLIDFVESKGLQGSEKLDKGSDVLARSLFDEYKALNPSTTISYELVASVQYDMQKLKQSTQSFAERKSDPNAKKMMSFVSKVDGWFGSRTSQSRYPFMVVNQYHNNDLVSSENLGLLDGDMAPEKKSQIMKKLPAGVTLEKLKDGYYYADPSSGDLVKVSGN